MTKMWHAKSGKVRGVDSEMRMIRHIDMPSGRFSLLGW